MSTDTNQPTPETPDVVAKRLAAEAQSHAGEALRSEAIALRGKSPEELQAIQAAINKDVADNPALPKMSIGPQGIMISGTDQCNYYPSNPPAPVPGARR